MPDDKYAQLRSLPFDVLAGAHSTLPALSEGRATPNWAGPCPVHAPKKWHCRQLQRRRQAQMLFLRPQGKGAIDLAMAVKGIGFREAVSVLESAAGTAPQSPRQQPPSREEPGASTSSESLWFAKTYRAHSTRPEP
jgi:hypothetical protein